MIVVEGKRTRDMSADELDERIGTAARVVVDVGTGDGRWAYTAAEANPDWLVVGIDAISERLAEYSAKAGRKPAKGGAPNALFVRASAEQPPPELHHRADAVHVHLPWGALLAGLVAPDSDSGAAVLDGLAALAKTQASLTVVLNAEPWEESTPKDVAELPAVTVADAETRLAPLYAARGIVVHEAREMTADEVRSFTTTWSRKLAASHRGHPKFVLLQANFER